MTRSKGKPRRKQAKPNPPQEIQYVDTVVEEGSSIAFLPTGETIRVTSIDDENITVEKTP